MMARRRRRRVTILDIPDVPLQMILKECDLLTILSLRKTCHDLRSYLKIVKPIKPIKSIYIIGPKDTINLTIILDGLPYITRIDVAYKKNEHGCQVIREGHENWKIFKNLDFMEVFLQDLQILMENPVEKLEFCTANGLAEEFGKFFRKQEKKFLKVKDIKFNYIDQEDIMNILPYLCPHTLEKMNFGSSYMESFFYLTLTQVTETEQWKKCQKIELPQRTSIMAPIQNCLKLDAFTKESCAAWVPTVEDLKFVRNLFLLTPSPSEKFYLHFDPKYTNTQPIYAVLGRAVYNPEHLRHDIKQWMYKKSPEYVVKITQKYDVLERKCFKFEIVRTERLTDYEKLQVLEVEEIIVEEVVPPEVVLEPEIAVPEVLKVKKTVKISEEKPVINNYEVEECIDPCHVRVFYFFKDLLFGNVEQQVRNDLYLH